MVNVSSLAGPKTDVITPTHTPQVGLPVGVLTVGVMTVGAMIVGVLTVGTMERPP